MKRFVGSLLLVTFIFSVLSLSSCKKESYEKKIKEGESYQLINAADENMAVLDSYTVMNTVKGAVNIAGTYASVEVTETSKFSGMNGDSPAHNSETYSTTKGDNSETAIIKRGWSEGSMYYSYVGSLYDNALYSEISFDDYRKHYEEINESAVDRILWDEKLTAEDSVVYRDDGGVTVTLSGFNDAFYDMILPELVFNGVEAITDITYIEIVFEISDERLFESTVMTVTFDVDGTETVFTQESRVSDINSTTVKDHSVDGYKKIDDIRLIDKATRAITAMRVRKSIKATLDIDAALISGASTKVYTERDEIAYDRSNGLTYKVTAKTGDTTVNIEYADTVKTVRTVLDGGDAKTSETNSRDIKEWAFLLSFLDYGMFNAIYVTDAKRLEDGSITYVLDINPVTTSARPAPISGIKMTEIEITLHFVDDTLNTYSADLEYEGASNGSVVRYSVKTTCDFD